MMPTMMVLLLMMLVVIIIVFFMIIAIGERAAMPATLWDGGYVHP